MVLMNHNKIIKGIIKMIKLRRSYQELAGKVPVCLDTLGREDMLSVVETMGEKYDQTETIGEILIEKKYLALAYEILEGISPIIHFVSDDMFAYIYLPLSACTLGTTRLNVMGIEYNMRPVYGLYVEEKDFPKLIKKLYEIQNDIIANKGGYKIFETVETPMSELKYRYAIVHEKDETPNEDCCKYIFLEDAKNEVQQMKRGLLYDEIKFLAVYDLDAKKCIYYATTNSEEAPNDEDIPESGE